MRKNPGNTLDSKYTDKYAYVELIHKSASDESVMSSKEFRGPIWKQLRNAIVHKNYENPRSIQAYIYGESIVITNYNKPMPPITKRDLNTKDSFPNRMYENPSIREMFRSLDLIESFGSGVGKAKRAMAENGSDSIYYQEYDESIDITSVTIPISRKYLRYSDGP